MLSPSTHTHISYTHDSKRFTRAHIVAINNCNRHSYLFDKKR